MLMMYPALANADLVKKFMGEAGSKAFCKGWIIIAGCYSCHDDPVRFNEFNEIKFSF